MKSVPYNIHHQVVCECPECRMSCIEDLGEDDQPLNMHMLCSHCETTFQVSDDCLD